MRSRCRPSGGSWEQCVRVRIGEGSAAAAAARIAPASHGRELRRRVAGAVGRDDVDAGDDVRALQLGEGRNSLCGRSRPACPAARPARNGRRRRTAGRARRRAARRTATSRGCRAARSSPCPASASTPGMRDLIAEESLQLERRPAGTYRRALGSRRNARIVVWSEPGARPRPRSMRPGMRTSSVPNCFGDRQRGVIRQHDPRRRSEPDARRCCAATCAMSTLVADDAIAGMLWCSAYQTRV